MSGSYWGDTGELQEEYNWLYDKLVPDSGNAETKHGEALRCISNIYYDMYNNGGRNLYEDCSNGGWSYTGWRKYGPIDGYLKGLRGVLYGHIKGLRETTHAALVRGDMNKGDKESLDHLVTLVIKHALKQDFEDENNGERDE